MRRALWWSNFTQLSATRFNMWYLLLLLGAGSTAAVLSTQGHKSAPAALAQPASGIPAQNMVSAVASITSSESNDEAAPKAACATDNKGCCTLTQQNNCTATAGTKSQKAPAVTAIAKATTSETTTAVATQGNTPDEQIAATETVAVNTYTQESAAEPTPAKVQAPVKKGRGLKAVVLKNRNEINNSEEKK